MARLRVSQVSFAVGEVSPVLQGRTDLKDYAQGCKQLSNVNLLVEGACKRRWGSVKLADLGSVDGRLEEFVFNDSQTYVMFLLPSGVAPKVYAADGTVCTITGTLPAYAAGDISTIDLAYSGDTIFIAHKSFKLQKMVRTGATTFTITDYEFETASSIVKQPYYKFTADAITLTPSATTGAITLTLSGAGGFVAGHVGLKIRHKKKQITVTGYTSATVAAGTCDETLTDTTASTDWDEQLVSAVRGYPRAVTLHENRLWLGGTRDVPSLLLASKSGAYFNFDVGTALATESIQVRINFDHMSEIRHIVSGRHLLVFADQQEIYAPNAAGSVLTPANIALQKQTLYGSNIAKPRILDDAALFVTANEKTVRDTVYDYLQASYASNGVSLRSGHLLVTPRQLAVMHGSNDGPEQLAFLVNTDGTLAVYNTIRAEKLAGWVPWSTDGLFTSMACTLSQAFAATTRTINSVTKRYLEVFTPGCTLDCAISYTTVADQTVFTGLSHLEAKTVHVVAGSVYYGSKVVSGGSITIDDPVPTGKTVYVGLNYTPVIETLPPIGEFQSGPMMHEMRRISRATVQVYSTLTFQASGQRVFPRTTVDDMTLEPTPTNKILAFRFLGYSRDPTITFTFDIPLPFTIRSLVLEESF